MTRDEYNELFHKHQLNLVAFKMLNDCDEEVLRLVNAVIEDEREACANIDWATILRHGGIVTRGEAENLAYLVTAAIRVRGQDPMPLFDDWNKDWTK